MRTTRTEYLNKLNEKEELKTKAIHMYEMSEALWGDINITREKVRPVKEAIEAISVWLSQAELNSTELTRY